MKGGDAVTLDQIEHVLRELGWRGKPGTGPEVWINNSGFGVMWIEKGLVVFERNIYGTTCKSWRDPSEITKISPTSWSKRPAPLRVVE